MSRAPTREAVLGGEYHSYILRVRTKPSGSRRALAIRVEYVNKREAGHFSELTQAFDFIVESVRHEIPST
jgi:hypothetical protein